MGNYRGISKFIRVVCINTDQSKIFMPTLLSYEERKNLKQLNRDEEHFHDARCPSCKSRKGSRVTRSFPTVNGRIRDRICLGCGYQFQTTEVWPTEKVN